MPFNFEAFRNGDERQFALLFRHYRPQLCAYAIRLQPDPQAAEELAMDSLAALWQHRHTLRSERHLHYYLFAVARNACFNYRRGLKARRRMHDELWWRLDTVEDDIEQTIIRAETRQRLAHAINAMPAGMSKVLMACMDNNNTEAIARRLRLSPKTVQNQRTNAVKWLAQHQ